MSKIDELIRQLCPDGVEFRRLGEVCEIKRGKRVVRKDLNDGSKYPVYQNSLTPLGFYDYANYKANTTFVISAGAAGDIGFSKTDFWAADDCLGIPDSENVISRYVYHFLLTKQSHIKGRVRKASVPRLAHNVIEDIEIPLPPLAVQQEIVRILDKFTQLEAELEAELEARKKQYAYYRDTLLSFSEGDRKGRPYMKDGYNVQWRTLGEVCEIPKQRVNMENVSCYVGVENLLKERGGVSKDFEREPSENVIEFLPNDVLIGNIRPYLKKVWQADCTGGTNGDVFLLRKNKEDTDERYLYFVLSSDKFLDFLNNTAKGGKMPRGDKNRALTFKFPLPPLPVQRRIAETLDKFEALTADLQSGLPAEIAARRKQYEHYRDRLLTFKKKES